MTPDNKTEKGREFSFLRDISLREPNLTEVLREIDMMQNRALKDPSEPLASLDALKRSRNIKIPYTTARDNQIKYLVEHLLKNYPDSVRTVATFDFRVDEATKNLDIAEHTEFTVMLNERAFEALRASRDARSSENVNRFIANYRLLNLSRLIKKSVNKADLARVLKAEIGKNIFTYKHYRVDKNKVEIAEEYCFHASNYNAVRTSLNLDKLKAIAKANSEPILRRLKKYGILSADFSDYRDSKLEYIFHVLIDDMGTALPESDLMEARNTHSLRSCLLRVDTILDPAQTLGADIVRHVRECGICDASDITAALPEVTPEIFGKWETPENLENSRILRVNYEGEARYIDGAGFLKAITGLAEKTLYSPEKLESMPYLERHKAERDMALLCAAGRDLAGGGDRAAEFLGSTRQGLDGLKTIIGDYDDYLKRQSLRREIEKAPPAGRRKKRSLVQAIIDFFKSLFSGKAAEEPAPASTRASGAREMSRDTRKVCASLEERNAPLIALSDFIDLSPENGRTVDTVINDLREHNVRVVVPVYNARKTLYPKRSQKLIIPDVEYLLVSPDVCRSPDEIRAFADSLAGFKLRDEPVPGTAIMSIEKYLLTVYRQKRAQQFKREM